MKLGVIGVGNMGAAIIKGCIASGMKPENIFGTGRDPRRTAAFAEETGIQLCEDIGDLVTKCDAVMIAVKPKDVRSVLKQAAQYLTEEKVSHFYRRRPVCRRSAEDGRGRVWSAGCKNENHPRHAEYSGDGGSGNVGPVPE